MLKVLFVICIGILTVFVVGTGIDAFTARPATPCDHGACYGGNSKNIERLWKDYNTRYEAWARTTSLIALIAGLIIAIVALAASDRFPIVADGALLGGTLTVVYGVCWGFIGGEKFRFVVGLAGLIVAGTLGYFKFVRPKMAEQ
ncbi:MAG: hypothetical protein JO193_06020 [Candidatus Eremiobacteraeota bacterium]|nr:hypothetical protein [Candidatus Eremiobacteraeota bacterium]MBV9972176.1 hypothetical protein [Candidatus Eremiobacteraeota bacterium]